MNIQTKTVTTVLRAFTNSPRTDFVPANYLEQDAILINARTKEQYKILIHRFSLSHAGVDGTPIELVLDKDPSMFDILDSPDGKIHLYVSSVKEETGIIW